MIISLTELLNHDSYFIIKLNNLHGLRRECAWFHLQPIKMCQLENVNLAHSKVRYLK